MKLSNRAKTAAVINPDLATYHNPKCQECLGTKLVPVPHKERKPGGPTEELRTVATGRLPNGDLCLCLYRRMFKECLRRYHSEQTNHGTADVFSSDFSERSEGLGWHGSLSSALATSHFSRAILDLNKDVSQQRFLKSGAPPDNDTGGGRHRLTTEIKSVLWSYPSIEYVVDFENVCKHSLEAIEDKTLRERAQEYFTQVYLPNDSEYRRFDDKMAARFGFNTMELWDLKMFITARLGQCLVEIRPYALFPTKHYFSVPIQRKRGGYGKL